MAYAAHHADLHAVGKYVQKPARVQPARRSLLRQVLDAIIGARQLQAQRDIERVLGERSTVFNDSLEREIGQRMFGGGWNVRR